MQTDPVSMRVQILVGTFVLGLAASVSAQVVIPISQPAGSAADLLSRAARLAADAQRRFAKPRAQAAGWVHGGGPDGFGRRGTSR